MNEHRSLVIENRKIAILTFKASLVNKKMCLSRVLIGFVKFFLQYLKTFFDDSLYNYTRTDRQRHDAFVRGFRRKILIQKINKRIIKMKTQLHAFVPKNSKRAFSFVRRIE